jgi:hypothetical protein
MYPKRPLLCVAGSPCNWCHCGRSCQPYPSHRATAAHRVGYLRPVRRFLHFLCMLQECLQGRKEMISYLAYVEERELVQSTDL